MRFYPVLREKADWEPSDKWEPSMRCCSCGSILPASKLWADADGIPFVSYYCEPCKQHALNPAPPIRKGY